MEPSRCATSSPGFLGCDHATANTTLYWVNSHHSMSPFQAASMIQCHHFMLLPTVSIQKIRQFYTPWIKTVWISSRTQFSKGKQITAKKNRSSKTTCTKLGMRYKATPPAPNSTNIILALRHLMKPAYHTTTEGTERRLLMHLTQTDRAVNTQSVIAAIDGNLLCLI